MGNTGLSPAKDHRDGEGTGASGIQEEAESGVGLLSTYILTLCVT